MALKDWKKISEWERVTKWHKNRTKSDIFIIHYEGFSDWAFYDWGRTLKEPKFFKTKSQALKFAKSYMRKH